MAEDFSSGSRLRLCNAGRGVEFAAVEKQEPGSMPGSVFVAVRRLTISPTQRQSKPPAHLRDARRLQAIVGLRAAET
jgi:hypothetical protein